MPRSKSAKRKLELWQERTRKFFRTHPSGVRPGTMTAPNMFPGLHGGSDLNPTAGVPGINHSFSVDSNNDGGVSGGSTAAAVCGNNDSGDSGTSDVSVDDDGGGDVFCGESPEDSPWNNDEDDSDDGGGGIVNGETMDSRMDNDEDDGGGKMPGSSSSYSDDGCGMFTGGVRLFANDDDDDSIERLDMPVLEGGDIGEPGDVGGKAKVTVEKGVCQTRGVSCEQMHSLHEDQSHEQSFCNGVLLC